MQFRHVPISYKELRDQLDEIAFTSIENSERMRDVEVSLAQLDRTRWRSCGL